MVLAGGQRQHVAAVAHDDEAGFLAHQTFFDDDARAGGAHGAVAQHGVDSGVGLFQRGGDHDALAGGQAVGLDHDRGAFLINMGVGQGRIGEGLVAGGRDVVPDHEGLGVVLRAFQLRSGFGGAEDFQATGAEHVHDASGQRRLGADDRQGDPLALDEISQFLGIGERDVFHLLGPLRAAVARSDVHLVYARGAGQPPGEGMFAAARANYQEFHVA